MVKREEVQRDVSKTFEGCQVGSAGSCTPIRALGYWFYISEVPEGGNLKRFCINYLLPTSYKRRKSPPKKNIISMLLFAWSSLKVKEISKRRHWKNHLHPFKLSVAVGTARGSRKALKLQQNSTSVQKSQPGRLETPTLHWALRVNGHIDATRPCSGV